MTIASPVSPLDRWALDPSIVHLNHGSYGGCLRSVLAAAAARRERLEAAPMRFLVLEWQAELDRARADLADFLHAPAGQLAFVTSSTVGVAIALASTKMRPGDELLTTDHCYRACKNQLDRLAAEHAMRVVVVPLPVPFDAGQLVERVARAITPDTRLALLDHVTSPTALVLPIAELADVLAARGVTIIVDGAHAPGQLELDVSALLARGVTYYIGNCHKWLCAPKGSAFFVAAERARIVPVVTSHGASLAYGPANRLHAELDWPGTHDPTPHLTVPAAIADVAAEGGGWPAIRTRNHALARALGERFIDALVRPGAARPTLPPPTATGCMIAVPVTLPPGVAPLALEQALLASGWEVPIVGFATGPLVRMSAHLYNHVEQAEQLARELHVRGVQLRL